MRCRLGIFLVVIFLSKASALSALEANTQVPSSLHPTSVSQALGVNIHFTDPQPGEMTMISESGVGWLRMDLNWASIEKEKGKYDFSAYDRLFAALASPSLHILLIMSYTNPIYDQGLAPHTDEGRKAFAHWASSTVKRYAGRGVLWEMWNEPNVSRFWLPEANVQDYAKLALAVGKAIRETAPRELYVGPATSHVDFYFLEECFKAGLLDYWDAVTVHPYRSRAPESWGEDLRQLRDLIQRYAPTEKQVPVLSGEWGYSDIDWGMSEDRQAKFLARQWLFNLSEGIPLSIWYDWRDDGSDPKESEHHFGTVRNPYRAGQEPVFDPKPAYKAAQTLNQQLKGFQFFRAYSMSHDWDYVLLFKKGEDLRLVAWTSYRNPHPLFIPAASGNLQVTDYLGRKMPLVISKGKGFIVELNDGPQYLTPDKPAVLLPMNDPSGAGIFSFVASDFRGCSPPNSPAWRCRQH